MTFLFFFFCFWCSVKLSTGCYFVVLQIVTAEFNDHAVGVSQGSGQLGLGAWMVKIFESVGVTARTKFRVGALIAGFVFWIEQGFVLGLMLVSVKAAVEKLYATAEIDRTPVQSGLIFNSIF